MEKKGKSGMISYEAREENNKPKKKKYNLYRPMPMKLDATKKT